MSFQEFITKVRRNKEKAAAAAKKEKAPESMSAQTLTESFYLADLSQSSLSDLTDIDFYIM